ncbi:MAG: type II CAAX endopeptidase family protein [Oscillospiraceae bacterium]|nr:type II CAAX endopeptidase family protein [Oscillospiraceae bacterium]
MRKYKYLLKAFCYLIIYIAIQSFFSFAFVYSIVGEISVGVTILSSIAAILVFWGLSFITKDKFSDEILLKKPQKPSLLLLVIPLGISLQFVISALMNLLYYIPFLKPLFDSYAQSSSVLDVSFSAFSLIGFGICGPIAEEVLFRGYIYGNLKKCVKPPFALLIQAFVFGLLHGNPLWILYATVLGIVLGLLRDRFESIYAPLLLHCSFNMTSFLQTYVESARNMVIYSVFGISFITAAFCLYMIFPDIPMKKPD